MRRSLIPWLLWGVVSWAVPLLAWTWVHHRLHDVVEPALSQRLGHPVSIGGAEVTLLGGLRLDDVAIDGVFTADAVEAGVGLGSLLGGRLQADEVRVTEPQLTVRTLPDGSLNVAALLTSLRRDKKAVDGASSAKRAPPRIVVQGGELVVSLDHGSFTARGVELHPQASGVRVVTGQVDAKLRAGPIGIRASALRAGVDLELPQVGVRRAALDGVTLAIGDSGSARITDAVLVVLAGPEPSVRLEGQAGGARTELRWAQTGDTWSLSAQGGALPLAWLAPLTPPWLDLGHATLAGRLTLAGKGQVRTSAPPVPETLHMDGGVSGARAKHDILGPEPVPLDATFAVDATWDPATRTVQANGKVTHDGVTLASQGTLVWRAEGGVASVDARVELGATQCADLLRAVPPTLRAPLDGLELAGTAQGILTVAFAHDSPDATKVSPDFAIGCEVTRQATTADVDALRSGRFEHRFPDGSSRRLVTGSPDFVPLAELPRHVWGAFVSGEDARFFQHNGFDSSQLARSLGRNLEIGQVERGGSTITQQLVKNVFLTHDRTLTRKLNEAVLTWLVERRLSKQRILEIYLSVIELGPGVYGLVAASKTYFRKRPAELTPADAAFLAALTPAPKSLHKHLVEHGFDAALKARVDIILRHMRRNGYLRPLDFERASRQPLSPRPVATP